MHPRIWLFYGAGLRHTSSGMAHSLSSPPPPLPTSAPPVSVKWGKEQEALVRRGTRLTRPVRCGCRSFHLQKSRCADQDNWSVKAIRRKTIGIGQMRYLRQVTRRFKSIQAAPRRKGEPQPKELSDGKNLRSLEPIILINGKEINPFFSPPQNKNRPDIESRLGRELPVSAFPCDDHSFLKLFLYGFQSISYVFAPAGFLDYPRRGFEIPLIGVNTSGEAHIESIMRMLAEKEKNIIEALHNYLFKSEIKAYVAEPEQVLWINLAELELLLMSSSSLVWDTNLSTFPFLSFQSIYL